MPTTDAFWMSLEEFKVALLRNSHSMFYQVNWAQIIDTMAGEDASLDLSEQFHTQWVTHGVRIREQVADDQMLATVLRRWLPPYSGTALSLFRGESADRFKAGRVGFCWTPKREVAEMFASGLNAVRPSGGVLLQAEVPAYAVIAGPGKHSQYLGEFEYTIEPMKLSFTNNICYYPPADRRKD